MKIKLIFAMLALTGSFSAHAALNILACEPEWGALAQELGGDKVKVANATSALQDPHRIEARPSLIARARNADMLVCTGAELEIGWLPILLRDSGNAAIQPGQPGNFEATRYVALLEKPQRLDRADGDVHAAGNPHIQTDPHNIALVADAMSKALETVDAANTAYYQARHDDFMARWRAAIARWETQAAPLKGVVIVAQHQAYPYLENWLGLKQVATLEPKPGVEPSIASLSAVLNKLSITPAKMVVRSAYNDDRASAWLSQRANIPAVVLPFTVGGTPAANTLFGLFDDTINRLLAADKVAK
ncbi:metal ABC transporter substrate-binding protein [Sulfuriferula nivalis]|uniref:Zinc ABC transporter substrate-binding protein n=1 Tax=Sulfuriferula nivalis TaxID=2675298 RepID=A0A809RDQ7_9PROT|nr:zinc ABC transporter substrate-binding protein [Sulfuriferula nivalis]BBO99774.1 zinc ABC transporter substrate-binding protein [Sulfuriferula nivalis]